MQWLCNISESEQKERKMFLFRFLKEKSIFNLFRKKFDSDFFRMYVTISESGGRVKNFDDYLRFFLNSKYFSRVITYAFEWKRCGWSSKNEDENQCFWEQITDSFETKAKAKFDKKKFWHEICYCLTKLNINNLV